YARIPGNAGHLPGLSDIADSLKKHLRGVFEGGIEVVGGSPWIGELLKQPGLVISGSVRQHSLRHVRIPSRDLSLSRCPWAAFSWSRRSTKSLYRHPGRSRSGSPGHSALSTLKLHARRGRDLRNCLERRSSRRIFILEKAVASFRLSIHSSNGSPVPVKK